MVMLGYLVSYINIVFGKLVEAVKMKRMTKRAVNNAVSHRFVVEF
jgi:hypothetical protein